ncbi:MAG TPA: MraY family glycosyltransferase [Salinivirgaceae bacterium]|nr:MraY family glycosyltransferase [Salinivirgaceae bacterium]
METIIITILFAIYSFIFGFLLHRHLVTSNEKYTIRKANITGIRWNSQSKPILGGLTFYSLFIFGIINYVVLIRGNFLTNPVSIGILLVVTMAFIIGLSDDLLNTSPSFKFAGQIACALMLINFNIYIKIFEVPMLNYLLTIFWVVGMMNSINMLDNMDAITSSISTVIFGFILFLVCTIDFGYDRWFFVMLILSAINALVSFLIFNWHPSKMYMGDNGSMFLGALLAILGILFVWNIPGEELPHRGFTPLLLIVLTYLIPITDTTTVSINRLLQGKSPFVGGRDHTTHHLSYLGLSDRQVALVLIFISLISTFLAGYLLTHYSSPNINTLLQFAIFPVLVFVFLYSLTRFVKQKK